MIEGNGGVLGDKVAEITHVRGKVCERDRYVS